MNYNFDGLVRDWIEWIRKVKYKVGKRTIQKGDNRIEIFHQRSYRVDDYYIVTFSNDEWSFSHSNSVYFWFPTNRQESEVSIELREPIHEKGHPYHTAHNGKIEINLNFDHPAWKDPEFSLDSCLSSELRDLPGEWLSMKRCFQEASAKETVSSNETKIKRSINWIRSKGVKFRSKDDLSEFVRRMASVVNNTYSWPESFQFLLEANDGELTEIANRLIMDEVHKV